MLTFIRETNQDQLLHRAGRVLCEKIQGILGGQQQVNLAVPGGRSVAVIFEAMRREPVDWHRVHFFIIDERLVPIDHPDSNFKLLQEHVVVPLVQEGRISPENAHPFILDPSRPDRGALAYDQALAEHDMRYDIILLSSGEDGHVGALFPHHHSVANSHHGFIIMDDSPKPPPERMTSSLSLMTTARSALLLFAGAAKREALERFNDPALGIADCPAKLVQGLDDATVFTDLE